MFCSFSVIKQGIATQLIPSLSHTKPVMNPNKRDNMKKKINNSVHTTKPQKQLVELGVRTGLGEELVRETRHMLTNENVRIFVRGFW
jgi:hypothetical protein